MTTIVRSQVDLDAALKADADDIIIEGTAWLYYSADDRGWENLGRPADRDDLEKEGYTFVREVVATRSRRLVRWVAPGIWTAIVPTATDRFESRYFRTHREAFNFATSWVSS